MEEAHQTPSNQEDLPGKPEHGYLNDVVSIFKARQHPLILVEEAAFRWMGVRVNPDEDLDLLIRDSAMQDIQADLLATGQFKLVRQDLKLRFSDTYTLQVPRLTYINPEYRSYSSISLWSERVYMLDVDGDKIEVPDPHSWNVVLKEEHFELDPSWAQSSPISYTFCLARGDMVLPPQLAQSADMTYPIHIPTIPRMLDALIDQARYRITHAENFPERNSGNRPKYHLRNFVRYLHLEKPQQQQKVFPELAKRNREEMEAISKKFKRKPPPHIELAAFYKQFPEHMRSTR